jgi:hypothetical protein
LTGLVTGNALGVVNGGTLGVVEGTDRVKVVVVGATFDNAQSIASNQPSQTSPTSEPTTPDSNYRTLRDTDNISEYPSNGVVSIANQLYNQNQTLKAA